MSLIRKVFWPAIIAFGVLAVMAAMGGSNGTRVASADSNDFCAIEGPKVITVGKTYLYLARLDHWDDNVTVQASIDNIIGNSKITSFVDGDFNFGDYKKVGPTNVVNDLDIEDIFNIDSDLLDFFADPAGFNTPIAAISTSCENITDTLTTMIEEAIDRGNACNFFVTFTTSCWVQGNLNATVVLAQAAYDNAVAAAVGINCGSSGLSAADLAKCNAVVTTLATLNAAEANGGSNEPLYNDGDIDCPTQTTCSIAGNIITAAVAAMVKDINAGENDCDDIANDVENAVIGAGAAEMIAAQFSDYINDVCEHRWSDDFIDAITIIDVTCTLPGNFDLTFSDEDDEENSISMNVICRGPASSKSTITCDPSPCSVEIIPAMGNVSHSLVTVTLLDADGNMAGEGAEVDFTVDRCSIEAGGVATAATYGAARTTFRAYNVNSSSTAAAIEASPAAAAAVDSTRQADNTKSFANTAADATVASAVLGCNPDDANPTATPGVATVTAIIAVTGGQDVVLQTKVTVVGPPFSMTISASPATVRCGEKSTITVSVKDAIGQNVSEHTRIEAVTNAGGVLGGTGAVANNSAPVTPISSTVGETFSGQATFYLLTSEQHSGPYEVVVTTGGSGSLGSALGGVFSTPPVVIQTTVTCTLPQPVVAAPQAPAAAPTITAPRTGQGPSISPPNTGDAGLAATSGSSWALFALVGVAAFAVAGLATVKFARR